MPDSTSAVLGSVTKGFTPLLAGDLHTMTKPMPALVRHADGKEMFFNSVVAAYQGAKVDISRVG